MLIFFDSDTQNDFILTTGKFPVTNAENLKKNLESLTKFARKNKIEIISSVDRHFGTAKYKEAENSELEIWGGPFPLHCMDGTLGQKKIKETIPKTSAAAFVENKNYPLAALKKIVAKKEIVVEKQKFNVFSNPNTEKIIKMLHVKKAIIYGIALDYSIRNTALELRRRGIDVYLITDASKAFNVKPMDSELALRQMHAAGVHMKTTEDVLKRLPLK
ncbi:cysteine hydrolase [Candidatus Micrarchaeota archaeon]|nr:cysteine hydrolase [Candidatus Micrarchaeota archaeon]